MRKRAAIVGLFVIISGIAIFLIGCPPPVVRVRPPEPRVEVYGPPPHSLKPFGFRATGNIGEENGFGSQGIGRDVQSLMPFGYLVIGNREEEVGSGIEDIGSIGRN